MRIRSIATAATALALTVAVVPSASANSFTDRYVGGGTYVSYDDGGDSFCIRMSSSSTYDVASLHLAPKTAGRGPTRDLSVTRGQRKCTSLATAYEDSAYAYFGTLGYDPPCRCGSRYSGDFFS